jgi:hypothetical protein
MDMIYVRAGVVLNEIEDEETSIIENASKPAPAPNPKPESQPEPAIEGKLTITAPPSAPA